MKRTLLVALLLATTAVGAQQTCQTIGNQIYCSGGNLTGSQSIGNTTYYNYNNSQKARQEGMPSSSQQIGNIRYYDNGVTRQSIGTIDYYSNGVTRQRIGDTEYFSNGKTCQNIGGNRYCN